jgi:hypothetical protein
MFNIIMSNSNTFNNSNFQQTPISDAYQFSSFSQYINTGGLKCNFSPVCIFCSSKESTALTSEGSFRQCNRCKKNFKAILL